MDFQTVVFVFAATGEIADEFRRFGIQDLSAFLDLRDCVSEELGETIYDASHARLLALSLVVEDGADDFLHRHSVGVSVDNSTCQSPIRISKQGFSDIVRFIAEVLDIRHAGELIDSSFPSGFFESLFRVGCFESERGSVLIVIGSRQSIADDILSTLAPFRHLGSLLR